MNIIVAVYSDMGIGYKGTQTIVIPEDRRRFKELTDGGTVIFGRRTFEDISRLLPNRKNIVLTRDMDLKPEGVVIAHSVSDVLEEVRGDDPKKIFVIGGGEVYRQFLPVCNRAYVTKIEATPLSDTFFPDLEALPGWELAERGETRDYNGVQYSFDIYKNTGMNINAREKNYE